MSNPKPARVRVCRGCAHNFTEEVRGQRYCATCREVRAVAQEALRVKQCTHCGEERSTYHGICDACREVLWAKREAESKRKTEAQLARYGKCRTCDHPASKDGSGQCGVCRHKEQKVTRRASYQQEQAAKQAHEEQEEESQLAARYERLDDDQKMLFRVLSLLTYGRIPEFAKSAAVGAADVNSEDIDADSQDDIDAQFGSIMEGFDL